MARTRDHGIDTTQEELALFSVSSHAVFPGRTVLYCREVARAMGCTARHVSDLCAEGKIRGAVNIAGDHNHRNVNFWRIPVSAYDTWLRENSNLAAGEK